MNSEELRYFTALTDKQCPDMFRISQDGKRLYVLAMGNIMACLEGEDLDKMTVHELYSWHQPKLRDWIREHLGESCILTR
jgi:hypothetical protein